jgi:predicted fused transcriptional regulator/phosphomethylpyrimidine kinase
MIEHEVLLELNEALRLFVNDENSFILIPEVRSNLVYALPNASKIEEVAGIPGRITVVKGRAYYCLPPSFGVSDHMARLILRVMKYEPEIRSGMNVKYYEEIVNIIQDKFIYDRKVEPKEVKEKERESMRFMIDYITGNFKRIPKFIIDLGDYGKEPLIYILGKNPIDVVREALNLAEIIFKNLDKGKI